MPHPQGLSAYRPHLNSKTNTTNPKPRATSRVGGSWISSSSASSPDILTLDQLKADPALTEMTVCQRGTRLSITPVDPLLFKHACKLARFKL
jgi:predicted RNA-binding protein with PUA-like domain